jgi:predicted nucleotide-binding protein (sugar kinase/HSP70/actin superfamily)
VLDELGYPDIPLFAPVQDETIYEAFNGCGKDFSQMAWRGIVAVDLLGKQLLRTRPHERHPGAAEAVYAAFLQQLCEHIRNREKIEPVLRESRTAFAAAAVENSSTRPLVGIVGEIYIRSNRFGNENLIKKVEELGGEAVLAPVSEWILYTNYTAKAECRVQKNYYQLFKLMLKDELQKRMERRMEKIFHNGRNNSAEPSTEEILQNAQPYLDASFEGEAILSIGKSIDYLKRGVDGIITVMPFTCMPGTIVNAIMRRCRDDYHGFPLLNLAYDGQQETNAGIRLETFMHQVRTYKSYNA